MSYIWYDMDGLVFELFELVCHLKIYRLSICQFSWFSHLNISLPLAEHVIHMFVTFLLHLKRDPFSLSNKR